MRLLDQSASLWVHIYTSILNKSDRDARSASCFWHTQATLIIGEVEPLFVLLVALAYWPLLLITESFEVSIVSYALSIYHTWDWRCLLQLIALETLFSFLRSYHCPWNSITPEIDVAPHLSPPSRGITPEIGVVSYGLYCRWHFIHCEELKTLFFFFCCVVEILGRCNISLVAERRSSMAWSWNLKKFGNIVTVLWVLVWLDFI